jgi:hypothetical protein
MNDLHVKLFDMGYESDSSFMFIFIQNIDQRAW